MLSLVFKTITVGAADIYGELFCMLGAHTHFRMKSRSQSSEVFISPIWPERKLRL